MSEQCEYGTKYCHWRDVVVPSLTERAEQAERARAEERQEMAWLREHDDTCAREHGDLIDTIATLRTQLHAAQEALREMTEHYVSLVNCGDCGSWNPEEEAQVIRARRALISPRPTKD